MNCDYSKSKKKIKNISLTKNEINTAILGTTIYILFFIIIIPIILYKLNFTNLLKIYIINTDLISIVISYHKGPFQNIFKYLYNNTDPFIGYLSQNIINLSVLTSLFYFRLTESKKENIYVSISKITLILLITYLLPGRYIIKIQDYFYNYLGKEQFWNAYNINGIISVFIGLFIVLLLISLEAFSVYYLSNSFAKFINNLSQIIK
jgi:hypothetical protein